MILAWGLAFCLVISLSPFPLLSQTEEGSPSRRARPTAAVDLTDRARSLPPEFASRALLRLSASPVIPDAEWKTELIEEAYLLGARAQLAYPHDVVGLSADASSRMEFARNDLDSLTLQTHAVEAMLLWNRSRARAMYVGISVAEIPKRTCQEVHVPDVSGYFKTAGLVFAKGFTDREREAEEDVNFLQAVISTVRSPVQVDPAFSLLLTARLMPTQRGQLIGSFSSLLENVSGDDRSFGSTEYRLIPAASPALADNPQVIPALRSYILRHLNGPRCADNIPRAGKTPPSVRNFNGVLTRIDPDAAVYRPIADAEVKRPKDQGTYASQFAWRSARGKELLGMLQWLNHGNRTENGKQLEWTLSERSAGEWRSRYALALKRIEGWKESEEDSPADYLFVVAHTYASLALLAPDPSEREPALARYLQFLEQRYASEGSRNRWFSAVRVLFDRIALTRDEGERSWLIERFKMSSNPVISLYAELESRMGSSRVTKTAVGPLR